MQIIHSEYFEIANKFASFSNWGENQLSHREILHRDAIHALLKDDAALAMKHYREIVSLYPSDLLALFVHHRICQNIGDSASALTLSAAIATYWSESSGDGGSIGLSATSRAGHALASSLIALGLATHGHTAFAEQLANIALKSDDDATPLACLALGHACDYEG